MKKLFFILAAALMTASVMAEVKSINPTACGITVGGTTKTGKTLSQWADILKDYRPMNSIVAKADQEVMLGNFEVEGFHMSLMDMELINDTVYQLSFYEDSPYADCWDLYKDLAFALRDKYAHFEDVTTSIKLNNDSAVTFYKTDGKTNILFTAFPKSISITLTSVYFDEIKMQRLYDEMRGLFTSKTGPNYDEKNKVTAIAGVRFGESKTSTINAFKNRGTFLENEGNLTYFTNVNFGGAAYDLATLYFQYDSRRYDNVLAAAKFEKTFYEWRKEEAIMTFESIVSKYQAKYTNYKLIKDEEDAKIAICGMFEDDYDNGNFPPIIISLELGVSRGGDKFYYVTVSYFDKRMSRVANDDI